MAKLFQLPTRFANGDVVVMDVDETVLDNSTYQKERKVWLGIFFMGRMGKVKKPHWCGVAAFIDEVVARNGKVALITNRNKALIVTPGITFWRKVCRLPRVIPVLLAALLKTKKR